MIESRSTHARPGTSSITRARYLRLLMSPRDPLESRLSFDLIHCTHDQRYDPACIHTRSICNCRRRSVSEPEGNERFSCTLKGPHGPTRDARLTSADCCSEDRSLAYQAVEHHPGKKRRVYPLEIAKVSEPGAVSTHAACPNLWFYTCQAGSR
jgi:hypothetical protein